MKKKAAKKSFPFALSDKRTAIVSPTFLSVKHTGKILESASLPNVLFCKLFLRGHKRSQEAVNDKFLKYFCKQNIQE